MSDQQLNSGQPVTMRSLSPTFLEQFDPNDETFNNGLVSSPGSKRCPTLKDYTEKIKQLQHENFQLKVRIYLSEQKTGAKPSSSDIAVFSQMPAFQNGFFSSHSIAPSSASVSSASALESLNNELDKVKTDKTALEDKVTELQEDLSHKQKLISELKEMNTRLEKQNEDILQRLEEANRNIEELKETQRPAQTDEEVDKLAVFAFEQNEWELRNSELESKLQIKENVLQQVQAQVALSNDKLQYYENRISKLELELRCNETKQEDKIREMTASLREIGKKCIKLQDRNQKLERKLSEKTKDIERNAFLPTSDSIQKLVELLQYRMRELTEFVQTLLHLESQKVVSLTGLSDENRENLLRTVEQARLISESLDTHFNKGTSTDAHHRSTHSYLKDHHRGILSPGAHKPSSSDRTRLKSENVQCNILDPSLENSLESANVYINKLKKDISIMERINAQLGQEKEDLISQVRTLESNVNFLKVTAAGPSTNILSDENKQLTKRLNVTENALKNLHAEHAKLVAELKVLRNTYQKSTKASIGSTMVDLNRPSDSTSPDLGIDSGHDGAVNSDDSNGNNYKEENRILRTTNRELAIKLKQTKQALDNTLEKLNSTTKEKEQVEKAICRQLHKTHTILRQAKRSVEKFTSSQCQENIAPPPPPPSSS